MSCRAFLIAGTHEKILIILAAAFSLIGSSIT